MNKSVVNPFLYKDDWKYYSKITFLYTLFLMVNYFFFQAEVSKLFYDLFLFHFDASLIEFTNWYPNFGHALFIVFYGLKISAYLLIFYFIYQISKRIIHQFRNPKINTNAISKAYIVNQTSIFIIVLGYYVGLYFLSKHFFSHDFSNFQLVISRGFLIHLGAQIIRILLTNKNQVIQYLKAYFFTPQLPYNIAILRILFFAYLAFIYCFKFASVLPIVSLKTKVGLPYMGWFINALPINADLYTYFFYIGIVSCFFIVLGFKTRFFLLLNAVCVFYLIATPNFFGKLWHEQLVIWISWFFMFSNCFDVYSMDSWIKKAPITKSPNYTFPVRFVWVQLGIIYFWAGFYKIWDGGFEWTFGRSMINQVQLEWIQNYDSLPAFRIDLYPYLLYFGGLIVILFELFYFYLVFKPKLRWIAACGGLLMHNLIGYFMNISFFTLLQVFYVFYIDFNVFYKKKATKIVQNLQISRGPLYAGIVLLNINFIFGMFHIDSYPFSSYPSYSAIIPDTFKMIHFQPNHLNQSVHAIGKKNYFRWEDYGWLENKLIQDFEEGKPVQKRLEDYWQIWRNKNPQLKICDTIQVYLVERPVAPEGKYELKSVDKMGIIIQK